MRQPPTRLIPAPAALAALGLAALLALGGGRPALAADFADLSGHWAAQAVERMNAKGVARGVERNGRVYFEPARAVTRYEAVVMLVRILGLDQAARDRSTIPASFREAQAVPSWAFGHVGEAVSRGIIAGSELTSFHGDGQATRAQVATWLVRALGMADDVPTAAQPSFADLADVPAGSRGDVAVVAETGLMSGSEGRFRPLAPITRAEIAALLDRADRLLDNELDRNEVKGGVESVAVGLVVTPAGGAARSFSLTDGTVVYFEGMRAARGFIAPGDQVTVVSDTGGRALYVEVVGQPLSARGKLAAAPPAGAGSGAAGQQLQVRLSDGTTRAYGLSPRALLLLDGRPAAFRRLAADMEVALEGQSGAVTRVVASSRSEEVRGELRSSILIDREYLITLRVTGADGDTEDKAYQVPDGIPVTYNGKTGRFTDVKVRDRVTLKVRSGRAFQVAAESYERQVKGILKEIRYGDTVQLVIEGEAGTGSGAAVAYPLSSSATIRKDGARAGVTVLRAGDRVEASVEGDEIQQLTARTPSTSVKGTVVRVTIASTPELTVKTQTGEEKTYRVAPDVSVRLGSAEASLYDLKPGYAVTLTIGYEQVTAVKGTAQATFADLKGVIRYIDSREGAFVLELADGQGNRNVKPADEFLIFRSGKTYDRLSRLNEGDIVIVVGEDVPGEPFRADVIVVVGAE